MISVANDFSRGGWSFLASIFALSTVLMPFTQLRVGGAGFGEVAAFIVSIYLIFHFHRNLIFSLLSIPSFFLSFIFLSFVGLFVNGIFVYREDLAASFWVFDCVSYVFVFLVCFSLSQALRNDFFAERMGRLVFLVGSAAIVLIFMVSIFLDKILGFSIRTHGYFSPFSNNLHQTASFMIFFPFLALHFISRGRVSFRLFWGLMIPVLVWAIVETGSFKALFGLFFGVGVFFTSFVFRIKSSHLSIFILGLILTVFIICLFGFSDIGVAIFSEEDKGGARHAMWADALSYDWYMYIFGGGFGPHIFYDGGYHDAHQTLLTILLQGGFFSFVIFVGVMSKFYWGLRYHPALLASAATLLPYMLGGDVLRRLPVWIMLLVIHALANQPSCTVRRVVR